MTKLEPIDLKIQVRDMVTRIYQDLKGESKDFGELGTKCFNYCKEIEEVELGLYVKVTFGKLLEHDMKRARIEPIRKRRNRVDLKGERFI